MDVETFKVSFSFLKNQCYLVYHNGKGVLIDPAWSFNTIHRFMTTHKIELSGVLLTHSHLDHTNLANKFAKRYDCPVFMSEVEIDHYGFQATNLIAVNHLENIDFGEFQVTPILTPGHTQGSTCYLTGEHLFTGDTFFIEGVGTCGSNKEHASALFDSVQLIQNQVTLDTKFWPGHSFGESPGKDLRFVLENNVYFQLRNRDQFIQFRTRKNRPGLFGFK